VFPLDASQKAQGNAQLQSGRAVDQDDSVKNEKVLD
jgi:hypothetical protein